MRLYSLLLITILTIAIFGIVGINAGGELKDKKHDCRSGCYCDELNVEDCDLCVDGCGEDGEINIPKIRADNDPVVPSK